MAFKHSTQIFTIKKFALFLFTGALELITKKTIILDYATSIDDLNSFFKKLLPVNTGYPLIRIGGVGDGGYLLPDDLDGIVTCISPGFGKLLQFEKDLRQRKINSIIIDREIEIDDSYTKFEKYFLSSYSNESKLLISLSDLFQRYSYVSNGADLLLQMDIEGSEWLILQSIELSLLKKFRIMIIEFHSLPKAQNRFIFEEIMSKALSKILDEFYIVHLHANNSVGSWRVKKGMKYPDTLEITFHRKDRNIGDLSNISLPHLLDTPTNLMVEDFDIKDFIKKLNQ